MPGGFEARLDNINRMLKELRGRVRVRSGRPVFEGESAEKLFEGFMDEVVGLHSEEFFEEVYEWLAVLKSSFNDASKRLGVKGWVLSKEFKSFTEDPRRHLRKKLFIYTLDLVRRRMSLSDYLGKAKAAITTSVRTNMRTAYQTWILLTLLSWLGGSGGRIVYPEHPYVSLDRSGRQKGGSIPPNVILKVPGRGYLSVFIEAPRPLGWGDISGLREAWGFYTSFRPDIMVYRGVVTDIVERDAGILGVKRPDVIVECKELDGWYDRVRDLRGLVSQPMTASEWYKRWIEGLYEGLGEVLGVRESGAGRQHRGGAARIREYEIVRLYKERYRPRKMILVSKPALPGWAKRHLENSGVQVIDGVRMGDSGKLRPVYDELVSLLDGDPEPDPLDEVHRLLREQGLDLPRDSLEAYLASYVKNNLAQVVDWISRYKRYFNPAS